MSVYRPSTSAITSGTIWTTPEYVYDNNLTSSAYKAATTSTLQRSEWSGFASVAGITAMTIDIAWYAECTDAWNHLIDQYIPVNFDLEYSWNGTTWLQLDTLASDGSGGGVVPGGPGQALASYTIADFAGKDLSTLKVRGVLASVAKPAANPSIAGVVEAYIYEIQATITAGTPSSSGKKILRCRVT